LLLVALAVGLFSAWLAGHLDFRGSFLELLPQSAPEVKDLKWVAKKAGGDGYLILQVLGSTPDERRKFADEVAPKLETLPEVRYVEYRYSADFFRKRALWLLSADKLKGLHKDLSARIRYEKEQVNPLVVDLTDATPPPSFAKVEKKYAGDAPRSEYIEAKNGQELYLLVKPNGFAADLGFCRRLVSQVMMVSDTLVAAQFPALKLDTTGAYKIRIEEDAVMKRDLVVSSVLSLVFATLLILVTTRRPVTFLSVGVPLVLGLTAAFAIADLAVGHLNVVTGFLVAILIGLGIEYGVHLSMRYFEERREHPPAEAMRVAVHGTFSGAFTSALTNAAAFFALVFARFEAFQQFGLIAGVGVVCTLIAAYAVGPATLALAERVRPFHGAARPSPTAAETLRTIGAGWPTPVLLLILAAVVGFAGYSLSILPKLTLETDMRKLKGDSPALHVEDHMTEQLGMQVFPSVWLVDNLEAANRVSELVRASQERHGSTSVFQKAASLNDFFPRDVEGRGREIRSMKGLLADLPESVRKGEDGDKVREFEEMLEAKPFGPDEVPREIRRRFQALGGDGTFVLIFPHYRNYDTREIELWESQVDEVANQARQEGMNLHILDSNLIAGRIFRLVYGDGPYILWSASAVVFLAIWASLRSLRKALLVAAPLFLGMTCLAGAMHLFNVHLNFINGAVLTNLLAIAVDNSVHLYHRYEEEGPGSLGFVLRQTGFAAVIATLTNGAGYGALLVAHHEGLRSIGQLAVLGVICTSIGTTVLFPALLALLERMGGKGRGRCVEEPQAAEVTPAKPSSA
jgi:predicted RND superfamily exporter protein